MTDRDKFAAAALTGLLAAPTDKDRSWEYWARLSYEAADAMIQERKGVTKSKPAASPGIGSVTLWGSEREAIEACVKLIAKTKQHDAMPKGPFVYWKHRMEALMELLERTR